MQFISRIIFFLFIFYLFTSSISAQVLYPSYYHRDYYDVLRMKNDFEEPITYLPSLIHEYGTDSTLSWDIWDGILDIQSKENDFIQVLNPHANFSYSTNYPDGYNDGAVWEGKGLNSSFNFGFTGKKGVLSFTFAPVVYSAQNKDFDIPSSPTKNEFSYPFEQRIDWVERYGDASLTKIHPGQSEIRLTYRKFSLGLSSQNFILGPSLAAPILMSNNAGGIPHFDFGTAGPIKTKIGNIDFKMFWGIMDESDYFDDNPDNDQRYITGATVGFQPKGVPGLSLGLNRVLYREMFDGDFKPIDLFASVWKTIEDPDLPNDNYDQMASLMVRWKFKDYGFDAYVEFARNDFPGTFTDLFEHPERTRGTTLGLIKTFDLTEESLIRFVFEHTKLNKTKMSVINRAGNPTYYVHGVIDNGYTNLGQIMGAYIGPGSNAHHLKLQYFTPKGRIGINFDRVRFNDDYFISNFSGNSSFENDIRYRVGLDYLRFIGNFIVDGNLTYGYRRNWFYNDDRNQHNLNIGFKVGYLLNN